MKNMLPIVLMLAVFSIPSLSQKKPELKASAHPPGLASFTLAASYAEDGHGKLKKSEKAQRNCFDFVSESEVPCAGRRWDIVYGTLRAGDEWDWFLVRAYGDVRSRMVSLGKKEWAQIKSLPEVEALPKLKPGEKRVASVATFGADAGTKGGQKRVTTNELFAKAVKGEMYFLRVVDDEYDFYVVIRVDDIVRGRSATISWKKLENL